MKKLKKTKDLGMTLEQASASGQLGSCYKILGKYYTSKTVDTAPEVQYGQCPSCGKFSWTEMEDRDFGSCSSCGFSG